jgi:drug/metabolite transporter (DMT)-like permease
VSLQQIQIAQIQMVLTGLVWGAWPILLRESGLKGNVSSAAFSLGVLIVVMPFAWHTTGGTLPVANWTLVLLGVAFGAIGMLLFNNALANSPTTKMGLLFVTMTVVQIAVPAAYQIFKDGKLTTNRAIGFGGLRFLLGWYFRQISQQDIRVRQVGIPAF